MKSRWVNPILAVLALSLMLGAGLASADPKILDLQIIGDGTAGGTCQVGALAPGCTSNSAGEVLGKHVGFGAYTLSLTAGSATATNSSAGSCLPANSLADTITAANGDTISIKTVGWLCEQGVATSPYHYNGTYRIVGGTGRFASAVGGGNLAATFAKGAGAATFVKLDGTINY